MNGGSLRSLSSGGLPNTLIVVCLSYCDDYREAGRQAGIDTTLRLLLWVASQIRPCYLPNSEGSYAHLQTRCILLLQSIAWRSFASPTAGWKLTPVELGHPYTRSLRPSSPHYPLSRRSTSYDPFQK